MSIMERALWTPANPEGRFLAATRPTTMAAIEGATAPDGAGVGVIEAVITVFGEPDMYGRVIERGAFDAGIEAHGLPAVVWTHMWEETPIGVTLSLRVEGDALIARGRLFVGDGDTDPGSDLARDIYRAVTVQGGDGRPAVREVSIGCHVTGDPVEVPVQGGTLWRFSSLDLVEWGPCLRGAHPMARIAQSALAPPDGEPATDLEGAEDALEAVSDPAVEAEVESPAVRVLTSEEREALADVLLAP